MLSRLQGNISRGSLNYERFPYYLSDVTGVIEFDRPQGEVWRFKTLRGVHASDQGVTQISGDGSFDLQPAPGRLQLLLTALNVPLDLDLQSASVRALPEMNKAWEELSPSGSADIHSMEIAWSSGPADADRAAEHSAQGRADQAEAPALCLGPPELCGRSGTARRSSSAVCRPITTRPI